MFEIEVVQEIWRTENTTMNVFYPIKGEAVVKGLRGEFSRDVFRYIVEKLKEKGITDAFFERKKNNEFYTKHVKIE